MLEGGGGYAKIDDRTGSAGRYELRLKISVAGRLSKGERKYRNSVPQDGMIKSIKALAACRA